MGLSELKQKLYELEEYGSGLIIMNHDEGRESYYRMHDSQISPAWMDPENSTALPVRIYLFNILRYLVSFIFKINQIK